MGAGSRLMEAEGTGLVPRADSLDLSQLVAPADSLGVGVASPDDGDIVPHLGAALLL